MQNEVDRNRWVWFVLCIAFAGLMWLCGWVIPMHLRAIEPVVLRRAGFESPSLVDRGIEFARDKHPESARLMLQAAQKENITGAGEVALALSNPELLNSNSISATEYAIRL